MSPTVLIVDDDARYRQMLSTLITLCFPHIELMQAEDGTQALSLTRETQFDLIILDYYLRAVSGSDVARLLRQRADTMGVPTPPIILMSAQPDVECFVRTSGAVAFLGKPTSAEDLIAAFEPFLEPQERSVGSTEVAAR